MSGSVIPPERIYVVIVTMGAAACEKQIRDVRRYPGMFPVLVLNGCAPDRVEVFRKLIGEAEGHCVILKENRGGAGGFRAGMQYVLETGAPDSQFVWLLDDDAELNPDTLPELIKGAKRMEEQGRRWGIIGSMLVSAEHRSRVVETGAEVVWEKGGFLVYNRGNDIASIRDDLIPCECCAAASMLTRMEILRNVGVFADIFLHFDDVEWCFRARKAGYEVVCAPRSFIHHPTPLSKPLTWVRYYNAANFIWFARLYRPELVRQAVRIHREKQIYFRLHGLKRTANLYRMGIRDGLRGEERLPRAALEFDGYVPPAQWKADRMFASASRRNLARFRKRFGVGSTRLFYLGRSQIVRIPRSLLLVLFAWTHPGTEIIVDDEFLREKQIPVFFRKVVFYNAFANMQIDY